MKVTVSTKDGQSGGRWINVKTVKIFSGNSDLWGMTDKNVTENELLIINFDSVTTVRVELKGQDE